MTAIEDPAAQPGSDAAGADQPSDELEHWLSELRTEVPGDLSGRVDEDSAGEQRPPGGAVEPGPAAPGPLASGPRQASVSESSSGGRHRAAD